MVLGMLYRLSPPASTFPACLPSAGWLVKVQKRDFAMRTDGLARTRGNSDSTNKEALDPTKVKARIDSAQTSEVIRRIRPGSSLIAGASFGDLDTHKLLIPRAPDTNCIRTSRRSLATYRDTASTLPRMGLFNRPTSTAAAKASGSDDMFSHSTSYSEILAERAERERRRKEKAEKREGKRKSDEGVEEEEESPKRKKKESPKKKRKSGAFDGT